MYTLKDLMEMLSIPERTIRRHLNLGILKGTKVGGVWKFSNEDLKDYFASEKIIKTQNLTRMNEIIDCLNGFGRYENQILVIKQYPKVDMTKSLRISGLVNHFKKPLFFNMDTAANKTIITLRGDEDEVFNAIKEINTLLN